MRRLQTSLALLTVLLPTAAFAQTPVTLDEEPAAASPTATNPAAPPAAAPTVSTTAAGSEAAPAGVTATTTAAPVVPPPAPAAAAPAAAPAARPADGRTIGGPDSEVGTWQMTYSGYFRAPFRMGIGSDPTQTVNADGSTGTKGTTLHSPVIPDDQYSSWQFTSHNKREWAEMFFTMGNGIVSGTVAIQAFQFTDPSWANPQAQFGIGQGWVELNHDLGFENIKFNVKVGSHWNRYGRAGVYDAGEYDTYLFGRTHVLGGTARMDIDLDGAVLGFEGGFGGNRPDPAMFNRARFTTLAHGHAFLKLDEMEFTAHLLHAWSAQEVVPLYPNVLPGSNCGTPAGNQCLPSEAPTFPGGANGLNGVFGAQYPNGSQTVLGVDGRFDLGIAGYLYGGFSHQLLSNALVVGNAIESIHSLGASNYNLGIVDNYLESSFCPAGGAPANGPSTVPNGSCSNGDGAVSTILAQYELGLANFDIMPGDQDLRFKLYGMLNFVSLSNAAREQAYLQTIADNAAVDVASLSADGVTKLKFGVDAEYFFLPFMSAGLRFDRLSPNNKIPEQAFMILSPRITFRSQLVTREQITISYSRYMYAQRNCSDSAGNFVSPADSPFRPGSTNGNGARFLTPVPLLNGLPANAFCVQPATAPPPPDGFGSTADNQPVGMRGAATLSPDVNVIKIEASMWW